MNIIMARKKPVEIEAVLYDGTKESADAIMKWTTGEADAEANEMTIKTLEGELHVSVGDYVIRGTQGEYYPCKPDIFFEVYEVIGEKGLPQE